MMRGKQKLYFLLDAIEDARAITPSGKAILIHPMGELNSKYSDVELSQLFTKLENDEKILKIVRSPVQEGYGLLALNMTNITNCLEKK